MIIMMMMMMMMIIIIIIIIIIMYKISWRLNSMTFVGLAQRTLLDF